MPLEALTLRIGPPVYGGPFVAQHEPASIATGRIELPFVIEGELVRLSKEHERPEILESSPERVVPRCRHFGECGGCQYQYMQQAEQVRTKARLLGDMMRKRSIVLPSVGIRTHAAEPWSYRNRVRFRLQHGTIGYSRRKSNAYLPVQECPILSPLLWSTAEQLQSLHLMWPSSASEMELFANGTDEALQLSLHLDCDVSSIDREAPAHFRTLCEVLQVAVPELKGAGLLVHAAPDKQVSRRIQDRQRVEVARWGSSGLEYRVQDHTYAVSRNAFFQVNRFLTGRMVELVVGNRTGELALDLFAGAGLFSVALAGRFREVVAVEMGQPAANDLQAALQACGTQHRAEHKTTLAFLREWNRLRRPVPDLVVMDPPRAGLGREVVAELLKVEAAELAYVSCDPTTFVRDCAALIESRYTLNEVHLLDLFPQTFHMETIALFRRR